MTIRRSRVNTGRQAATCGLVLTLRGHQSPLAIMEYGPPRGALVAWDS